MFELRWKVEQWVEHGEFADIRHTEPAKLQYRNMPDDYNLPETVSVEWQDVPTEYVEV